MRVHFLIEWQTRVVNVWTMNVIEFTENDSINVLMCMHQCDIPELSWENV